MRVAKSRAKSSSCVETISVRCWRAAPAAARRARRGAPDRATRSARPSAAAADRRPARARSRRAAPRRRTARAAAPSRDARRRTRAAARARALRAAAGATPCACTGARQTLSIAVRCSNRQWNWNTMPTLRRSSRSVGVGVAAPPVERDAVDVDRAGLERLEPGDRAQDRRLAGAGRSHQRDELAARDLERARRRGSPRRRAAGGGRATSRTGVGHAGRRLPALARAAAPAPTAAATSPDRAPRTACRESPSCRGWSRRSASASSARAP